jgi:hypothetical protein
MGERLVRDRLGFLGVMGLALGCQRFAALVHGVRQLEPTPPCTAT